MPRALIVGGSVGGLFAAALLRRIGWDVAVFEKSAGDLSGRGAGLGLSAELFEAMRRAGAAVDDTTGVPCRWLLRIDRDGSVASRIERPWQSGIWTSIYRSLRAAVPGEVVFPGRKVVRVEQADGGVVAHFEDGRSEAGDLLVACDGVQSTVRRQFLPAVEPRYAGYVAWRCLVQERTLSAEARALLSDALVYVFPPGEMSLSMPNPGRGAAGEPGNRAYYVIWYRPATAERLRDLTTDAAGRNHGAAIPPPLIQQDVIAEMRRDAAALLPPVIADVVTRADQPLLQAISDLDVPRMVFGRVVLLGDAAFVARPHVAAGITKAALDAVALADALEGVPDGAPDGAPDDFTAALAEYETKRLAFGQALVDHSRRLGAAALAAESVRDPEQVMRDYGASHLLRDSFK